MSAASEQHGSNSFLSPSTWRHLFLCIPVRWDRNRLTSLYSRLSEGVCGKLLSGSRIRFRYEKRIRNWFRLQFRSPSRLMYHNGLQSYNFRQAASLPGFPLVGIIITVIYFPFCFYFIGNIVPDSPVKNVVFPVQVSFASVFNRKAIVTCVRGVRLNLHITYISRKQTDRCPCNRPAGYISLSEGQLKGLRIWNKNFVMESLQE